MMKNTTKPLHAGAVLLDVDGTVLDSNDMHAHAWEKALDLCGRPVTFDEIRRCIGMGGDKLLRATAGIDEESDLGTEVTARKKSIFRERYLSQCHPFPRARALLEKMRANGLAIVVATSAGADELAALLEAARVSI